MLMRRLGALFIIVATGCDGRVTFSPKEIDEATLGRGLPAGFLLGTATAAHQIEGGNVNDWTRWETEAFPDGRPHVKDGSLSGRATDSWNRFDEDLVLMQRLGTNAYRFSVEWSRLEPEEGQWKVDVSNQYRAWAIKLRNAGITPMVTLYHFTLPQWVADRGGWENDDTVALFDRFARRVASELGGEVDLWCTINEPNVLAFQSYLAGIWPPGKRSSKAAALVMARLLEAHGRAAKTIRAVDRTDADGDGKEALVGLAHHVRVLQAATSSTVDQLVTGLSDDFFNEAVVRAAATGRIRILVPGEVDIDREVPELRGSFDYLGVNYYTRDHVRADLSDPSLSRQYVPADRPVNDLGWDLYPEGLYLFLRRLSAYGWPIYVTENGIADHSGQVRPGYLRAHLYALQRAAQDGVDVRGYFHWSLLDNFEWAEGYEPRFGLFRVDFDSPNLERTPTEAVETFREVARRLGQRPSP